MKRKIVIPFIGLIDFYRLFLSPVLVRMASCFGLAAPRCRFTPSCSRYAKEVMEKDGLATGLKLILIRLAKCQAWSKTG